MNKPTIIITGANGFIGEQLVNHCYALGWKVKALIHHLPDNRLKDVEYIQYKMEERISSSVFDKTDYFVHCAYLGYEKNKDSDGINIKATSSLAELCRIYGVKFLFISSFSAHPDAVSHYGKTKLQCEQVLDVRKHIIIKPGLVIGKKGLSGEIIKRVKHSAFFPLVGGGNQVLQTVYIDDLCKAIELVLTNEMTGMFNIAEPAAITMKIFYKEIATQLNSKIRFVPLSASLLYIVCRCFELIGLRLPVSSESVSGLKHLITFETAGDLKQLGIELKNYKESLKALLSE